MIIKPPVKKYDPFSIAGEINEFWARTYAYLRTKNSKSGMNKYYFVDGPPFATDKFSINMARNKIIKDCHIRFMRAQGFNVMDRPGFDMHGLPVEIKIEEKLGISYKTEIDELGVEKFVTACKNYANEDVKTTIDQFKELGIWLDWDRPYFTSDNSYIESVWWSLKEAYKNNHLTKQEQVTAWCSRCESPMTIGEIDYKVKKGHSVYFKIPIKGKRDEYIIVWTTTPWTFAGALAIAVNPDFIYSRVAIRQGGRKSTIIVLESQVEKIAQMANVEAYEIIESFKGTELENLGFFHPLMADIPFHKTAKGEWCHKIILLDSVYEGNTGSVYISPGFGTTDFKVGNELSLPIFSPVDERGVFTTEAGMKYAGQNIEEASNSIIADMKSLRFVLTNSTVEHKFGHCWRCETPIISRVTEQWFLKADEVNKILRKTMRGVTWLPECFGNPKYREKMFNAHDWCVSRQRYWGTPLPIWECIADFCGHIEVVGSTYELEGTNSYKEDLDLHKPWIDSVSLECPKCGGLMKRIPDTVDVWLDSSIASWGQFGYPRNKKAFNELWPGDWISEEQDQFKGWFLNQMFSGTMVFNKIPFRKAFVHEEICEDKTPTQEGTPVYSDIRKIVGMHGPDALRLYLLGLDPCKKSAFNAEHIKKAHNVLNVLWNCYVFSSSYMNMDNWDPDSHPFSKIKNDLQPEDVWILSRIETLNHQVMKEIENSSFNEAVEHITSFILEDMSRCYIKLIRDRTWKEGASSDKDAAFFTMRETLRKTAIISSPFIPYISEYIYQQLDADELSVSMVPWPDIDATNLSEGSERCMKRVREIVRTSHKLRQELGLSLRWPVKKMTISASNEDVTASVKMFKDVIKRQVNVKELELVPEGQEWTGQELVVVPNPNVIGKAYKQRESKIARMLKVLPAKEIKAKIEEGEYSLGIEGELIRILPEMVQFETKLPDGVVSTEFKNGIIYLDTVIDDEILAEGYAREIIRRIQQMRKDMELDPEEYISVSITMGEKFIETLENWFENIADATRAAQLEVVDEIEEEDYIVEWPLAEESVLIGITSLEIKKAMNEFLSINVVDNSLALAIVESGIINEETFLQAERKELLKIPGMTHSKLRKIKEYLEKPKEKRAIDEQTCPLCLGPVEPGTVTCKRCGKNLIADEELFVGPVDAYEDEDIYSEDKTRERVRIAKKKKSEPEEEATQPEDEVVRMATRTEDGKPRPEDTITSEIMSGIDSNEAAEGEPTKEEVPEEPSVTPEKEPVAPGGETAPEQEAEPEESEEESPIPKEEEELEGREPEELEEESPIPKEEEELEEREPEELEEESPDSEPHPDDKSEIIGSERDKIINQFAETFDIKQSMAKELFKHDYTSIEELSKATEEELRQIKGIGKITARRIVQKLGSKDTKMCALCNAIVPRNSPICTRCGVKFTTDEEKDMEKQLDTLEEIDKRLTKKPSDTALLHSKAMTLIDAGKREEALGVIDEALERSPDDESLLKTKKELEIVPGEPEKPSDEVKDVPTEPIPESSDVQKTEAVEEEDILKELVAKADFISYQDVKKSQPTVLGTEEEEIKLKKSFTYLVLEERSSTSYGLFRMSIKKGMPGYCVTRTFPEKIREKYELEEIPILWLSNVAKEEAVRPKDLEKLSLSLEEFLEKAEGIILLDGIEYLITNNNFITVLKLIQSLRDQVAINSSILLLSLNPSTMDNHQINLLKREVDAVIE